MPLFKIYAARNEDMNEGWVWIVLPGLRQRGVVRLHNPATGSTVYCEALSIDENFRDSYNAGRNRSHIGDGEVALVASEWYRKGLGGITTKSPVELEALIVDDPCSYFRVAWYHPQLIVRMSMILAFAGIVLSVVALGFAIFAAFWASPGQHL